MTAETQPQPEPSPALPKPPRKPEPHECCGTGCIPCVMDIYEEELWEYERAIKQLSAQSNPNSTG
ncbi:MAG: oxidoreductase-like domain-containing protein [Burkholderiales bacterium]|nr:hypothetical protein [Nitrosomonadaceae bacterium]